MWATCVGVDCRALANGCLRVFMSATSPALPRKTSVGLTDKGTCHLLVYTVPLTHGPVNPPPG